MAAGGSRPRGIMVQEEWQQFERRSEESGSTDGDDKQRVAANVEDVGPRRRKGKARGIFLVPRARGTSRKESGRAAKKRKTRSEKEMCGMMVENLRES